MSEREHRPRCPRCGLGFDTDGDGNCAVCARTTDEALSRLFGPAKPKQDVVYVVTMADISGMNVYAATADEGLARLRFSDAVEKHGQDQTIRLRVFRDGLMDREPVKIHNATIVPR